MFRFSFLAAVACSAVALCALTPVVYAAPEDDLIAESRRLNLSERPQWLSLLHLRSGSRADQIVSDDFYLSPHGTEDPQAELDATLKALFAPWQGDLNSHPRCRFPARYLWLSHHLTIPGYIRRDPRCSNLEKWALLDDARSISLYLIGGYFGNPASTFGHAVLKFNSISSARANPLFDITVGFGAQVPQHEWSIRYVLKGIFGGYRAGFLDKYYYAQDLVYSRSEFRDIWDFELNLPAEQRMLLTFHVWELLGRDFSYYFLDKNCAYRLAELIDLLVEDNSLTDNGLPWYSPVELFIRLRDVDRKRRERGEGNTVASVTFIPSMQRVLVHHLRSLTANQRALFDHIRSAGPEAIQGSLQGLPNNEQSVILDALLAYADYTITAAGDEQDPQGTMYRDQVLLARLRLPSRPSDVITIPEVPSPADGSPPMKFTTGVGWDRTSAFTRLSWSAFSWETVGQNSLEGDELVVSDLSLGVFQEEDRLFVDRYDFLRIINFATTPETSAESGDWSWELRIGSERARYRGGERYDGILALGLGKARQVFSSPLIVYGMVDGAVHSLESYFRLRPHVGVRIDGGMMKAWFYGGVETDTTQGSIRDVWGGKAQYQTTARSSVQVELSNERATRYSVGLNWYF